MKEIPQPSEEGKKRTRIGNGIKPSGNEHFSRWNRPPLLPQEPIRIPKKSVPARPERQSNEAKKHIRKSGK